jgi:hypothetical protein
MPDDEEFEEEEFEEQEEPVSRAELSALSEKLDRLSAAFDERREADSPRERERAEKKLERSEDIFERAAQRAGMTREQITKAVAAAKEEQEQEAFSRRMDRWLEGQDGEKKEKPKPRKRAAARRDGGKPAAQEEEGDSAPLKPHWTERSLSEILR